MKKIRVMFLVLFICVLPECQITAQISLGDAIHYAINGLQIDTSQVEMYGESLSFDDNTNINSKVLVDHSIVHEAIEPSKGRNFFLYKRIDKIVYLMPASSVQLEMKLIESMVEN